MQTYFSSPKTVKIYQLSICVSLPHLKQYVLAQNQIIQRNSAKLHFLLISIYVLLKKGLDEKPKKIYLLLMVYNHLQWFDLKRKHRFEY